MSATSEFGAMTRVGEIVVEGESTWFRDPTGERREVCNFGIDVVRVRRELGEGEEAELTLRYDGETVGVTVSPTVFKSQRRFDDKIAARKFGMMFRPGPFPERAVLNALSRYVAKGGGRR